MTDLIQAAILAERERIAKDADDCADANFATARILSDPSAIERHQLTAGRWRTLAALIRSRPAPEPVVVTDEMVRMASDIYNDLTHNRIIYEPDRMRAAIEAALKGDE
jgi:hypothetical protein